MTTETQPSFGEQIATLTGADMALEHFDAKAPAGEVKSIPIDALMESATNPRKSFKGIEELAQSITRNGLLVPLLVREQGAAYEVVAGARRLRACKLAGLEKVPCDVRPLTDVQVLELQVVENVQRSDLQPLEEADGYHRLMEAAGYTTEQVAEKCGKSKGTVYARLKLCALGSEGRYALEGGAVSVDVAVALARIPSHKDQAKAVAKLEGMTSREALDFLRTKFCVSLKGAPFNRKDETLVEGAPACTACPKRSGCGTPGLFEDLTTTGGDWCTDVGCFDDKVKAAWSATAKRHEEKGAEVLSIVEGAKLFKFENALSYGSQYVEAEAPVPEDKQRRSWDELLNKVPPEKRPRLVVAPDAEKKPRKLYVRADALKAIDEHLQVKWAGDALKKDSQKPTAGKPKDAATEKAEKELRELRDQVVQEVVFTFAAKLRKEGVTAPLARLLARAAHSGLPSVEYLATQKVKPDKAEKYLKEASLNDALAYVAANLLQEWVGQTWNGFEEELPEVAKAVGLDVEAMVKAKIDDGKAAKKP